MTLVLQTEASMPGAQKKKPVYTFNTYIKKVQVHVHPNAGMTSAAVTSIDNLCNDIEERLATEAARLAKASDKKTVGTREVEAAVKLVLGCRGRTGTELCKHAVSEGTKAVLQFDDSNAGSKNKPASTTKRAGLKFPPSRFSNDKSALRQHSLRVSPKAGVYMAGVIEYLVAEILELSGNVASDTKVVRITPHHINMAIHGDDELRQVFGDIALPGGGADVLMTKKQVKDQFK